MNLSCISASLDDLFKSNRVLMEANSYNKWITILSELCLPLCKSYLTVTQPEEICLVSLCSFLREKL